MLPNRTLANVFWKTFVLDPRSMCCVLSTLITCKLHLHIGALGHIGLETGRRTDKEV